MPANIVRVYSSNYLVKQHQQQYLFAKNGRTPERAILAVKADSSRTSTMTVSLGIKYSMRDVLRDVTLLVNLLHNTQNGCQLSPLHQFALSGSEIHLSTIF